MQLIIIAGNIGKDPELRKTQSGDSVLGFSVAVDNGKDKNGNKRDSSWYNCSVWGKRAEALGWLSKGMKVTITGRPSAREYNGKAYMEVSVNELTSHGGGQSAGNQSDAPQDAKQANYDAQSGVSDSEIPF